MNTLKCAKCGATSQSTGQIKECPVCETPNPNYTAPAIDPNAGGSNGQSTTDQGGKGPDTSAPPASPGAPAPTAPVIHPSAAPAAPAPAAVRVSETTATFETKTGEAVSIPALQTSAASSPAAPAAPKIPLATQIEQNAAIALDDVNEVAAIIGKSFAGTPVATIFALLGPAAGIGAAVLHQHLQFQGFDLSKLKTIDPIA